jgi:peroxiredoxin Q/BCP
MKSSARFSAVLGVAALCVASGTARAQQAPSAALPTPNVGDMAPDFTASAATRYGMLRDSVHLASLRGQTVVLAFFPKARTKG